MLTIVLVPKVHALSNIYKSTMHILALKEKLHIKFDDASFCMGWG
jgi:hypothetical protein